MTRPILVASALALALAACSKSPAPEATTAAPADATAAAETAPVQTAADASPVPEPTPAPATAAAAVADCATTIEASDMMKYNADSISVPASCAKFTINLKHVGKMPIAAMGHNVVIAKQADMAGIAADGMSVSPEHIKAGDGRVIAHTKMIGGGESTSVTFDVAKIKAGGPFSFFCSFPGHMTLMKGSIQVQ